MCARFTLTNRNLKEVADDLDAEWSPRDEQLYRPRYNVAPTDVAWVVQFGADRRVLRPATWSYLVSKGRPLINVRGEQVASGAGFRAAFESRRCAVVTDGFFEWPGKGLAPYWFHRGDGGLILLGGLVQPNGAADAHPRFTVLTTQPNPLVAKVHNRMPLIVPIDRLDDWLTSAPVDAAKMIGPAPESAFIATPVSKHVNSAKHDDPACIVPSTAEELSPAQGSLF